MVIKKHWVSVGAYGYLIIPFLIFCLGFLRTIFSIPISIILCYIFYKLIEKPEEGTLKLKKNELIFGVLLIVCWVWLSGIGGHAFQNWDFHWRNAVFRDLINSNWPVNYTYQVQGGSGPPPVYSLVYYFGYWLPSALVGKLAGWGAAQFALVVWTILGVFISTMLLKTYVKTSIVFILLFFVFFSGMDASGAQVIRTFFNPSHYPSLWPPIQHLEGWTGAFQYSSITTQLFWVFNQAVPVWICIALHLASPDPRRCLLLFSLCFFFAPLPALGFIPFIFLEIPNKTFHPEELAFNFHDFHFNSFFKHCWEDLKAIISPENLIGGVLVLLISYAYFSSNPASSSMGIIFLNIYSSLIFIIFMLLEWLILWILIAKKYYLDLNWYLAGIMLIIIPFLVIGKGINPALRISIPAMFLLMMWCFKAILNPEHVCRPILVTVLIIGALTPLYEINRSIYRTFEYYANPRQSSGQISQKINDEVNFPFAPEMDHPKTLLADSYITLKNLKPEQATNFIANIEKSFFQKYLLKEVPKK